MDVPAVGPIRLFAAAVVVMLVSLVAPSGAFAHTDLDYTLPTDGAAVGEPIDEITVAFTQPVTLVGNGFEVLEPGGDIVEPFAATDDDTVFLLQLDSPLAGGAVGVRYEVTSEDGHVVSGAFSFTVAAEPPPTTTTTTTATVVPATTAPAPATTESAEPESTDPESTVPPTTTIPPTTTGAVASTEATVGEEEEVTAAEPADQSASETPAAVVDDDGDDGGGSGLVIALVAAVGVAALGFLVVRSRTSG